MYLYYFLTVGYLQRIVKLSLLYLFIIMGNTKFFDRKKREVSSQSVDGNDSKRPREEIIKAPVPQLLLVAHLQNA